MLLLLLLAILVLDELIAVLLLWFLDSVTIVDLYHDVMILAVKVPTRPHANSLLLLLLVLLLQLLLLLVLLLLLLLLLLLDCCLL